MIIALTRDNENLIRTVCKDIDYDFQVMLGITNLRKFAIQEMKNLSNYEDIIIDLVGLADSEEDVVNAVVALKSMYNIKITILAFGYEHGNTLLAKLFNEGIYNFVTAREERKQEDELKYCLETGKEYKDSVRFRSEEITSSGDRIIIKKEYKKLKQSVTIAICGSESHIGVTTQALAITKFLNDLKLNACYIQANQKEDIETLESFFDVNVKEGFISYMECDLYKKDNTIAAMQYGYDFYIYDMGNIQNIESIDNFLTKDIKIVVAGTKSWEQDNLIKVFDLVSDVKDINYIFSFSAEAERNSIKSNMGVLGVKTLFSNYIPNPFEYRENEELYHQLLKDYIAERSIHTEIIPIEKKQNIFQKFMERRKK